MKNTPPADKETLDKAIRAAIGKNGGKRISLNNFLAVSGLRRRDFFHHYTKWEDAMRGVGFKFKHYHVPAHPHVLLSEWGAVVRKLRRYPTQAEYTLHARRTASALCLQFGSWFRVARAFRRFAAGRKEWAAVLALMDSIPERKTRFHTTPRPRFIRKSLSQVRRERRLYCMHDRPAYGDQLDIPTLRHAPVNEQGVIYLFGIIAGKLGFAVERMQDVYPDCFAKRRVGRNGKWQSVTIEFEYESRNFRLHRHDPTGCDLIVCWTHNWPDCPKHIEVIALQDEIKRLNRGKNLANRE